MDLQNIETGYKPEFSLGALYSGFNAGNAMNYDKEEILRQFLANQQKQQEMPYEVMSKKYQGLLDEAKTNDPNYILEMLKGTIGQMQSQQAAGTVGMNTIDSRIRATNAENDNSTGENLLSKMIRDLQTTGTGARIGFGSKGDASPQEGDGPLGLYQDVMSNPNITPEQKILIEQDAQKSGMLTNRDALLHKFMEAAKNTPKFQQQMSLGAQRGNFGLEGARIRTEGQLALLAQRIKQTIAKAPNMSQFLAHQFQILTGEIEGDKDIAEAAIIRNTQDTVQKNAAIYGNPGLDVVETTRQGKPVQAPSKVEQSTNPKALTARFKTGDNTTRKSLTTTPEKIEMIGSGTKDDPYRPKPKE